MVSASGFTKSILLISILAIWVASTVAMKESSSSFMVGWIPDKKSECRGTIAECEAEAEFDLDSEINRRVLATSSYISYGALRRDSTPCSRRGASYYNCRPGAQRNPYRRGCSRITQCRG